MGSRALANKFLAAAEDTRRAMSDGHDILAALGIEARNSGGRLSESDLHEAVQDAHAHLKAGLGRTPTHQEVAKQLHQEHGLQIHQAKVKSILGKTSAGSLRAALLNRMRCAKNGGDSETRQFHEKRLRASIPDFKPHELQMYKDLRSGGDNHSAAIQMIKGERLMASYVHRSRPTANASQLAMFSPSPCISAYVAGKQQRVARNSGTGEGAVRGWLKRIRIQAHSAERTASAAKSDAIHGHDAKAAADATSEYAHKAEQAYKSRSASPSSEHMKLGSELAAKAHMHAMSAHLSASAGGSEHSDYHKAKATFHHNAAKRLESPSVKNTDSTAQADTLRERLVRRLAKSKRPKPLPGQKPALTGHGWSQQNWWEAKGGAKV